MVYSDNDQSEISASLQLPKIVSDLHTMVSIFEGLPFLRAVNFGFLNHNSIPSQLDGLVSNSSNTGIDDRLLVYLSMCCPHLQYMNVSGLLVSDVGLSKVGFDV